MGEGQRFVFVTAFVTYSPSYEECFLASKRFFYLHTSQLYFFNFFNDVSLVLTVILLHFARVYADGKVPSMEWVQLVRLALDFKG